MEKKKKIKRHSEKCPCAENVKVQTEFFSNFINKLSKKKVKKQSDLISKADPCFIRYLSHCANGILKGDIKLSKTKFKELSPEKRLLIKLVRKSVPLEKKRDFIVKEQKGGFIGLLPGIAAAALSSILGKKISDLF